jgi:nucleoside-diphosphate-sugar epimerase
MVFASTEWVYGDTGPEAVNEDTPIDANRIGGEYALTKLAGERLLAMGARDGLRVTVLRFGIVYGPREDRSTWSAVESLAAVVREQGRVELKGSAGSARRFIHADDVARGILAAIGEPPSPLYNLTGDSLIRLSDVVAAAGDLSGRAAELVEGDPRRASIRNADNARARRELGWRPEIDLRKGLQTLWRW